MARGKRAAVAKTTQPVKPAGKRKRAETKVPEEEPAAKRAPASKRPPLARKQAAEALPPVTHPSHGQVCVRSPAVSVVLLYPAPAPSRAGEMTPSSISELRHQAPCPCATQAPYDLYVHGDGSCGQLGLGEDVAEKLRPFPLQVDGMKARHRASLACSRERTASASCNTVCCRSLRDR